MPICVPQDDRYGAVCITILESTFNSDQPGTGGHYDADRFCSGCFGTWNVLLYQCSGYIGIFVLPIFLWGVWDIPWLNHLLELCPGNLVSPAKVFALPAYQIGGHTVQVYQMEIVAAVCFTPVCAVCSYFGFKNHQVRS